VVSVAPAIYECRIYHARTAPISHAFTYRSYLWLVDLDDLPVLPPGLRPLARFRAADHMGDPGASIRSNVDTYVAGHGIDLAGGRVLMLTNARVLGYVFNPLTLYWCRYADGSPACVIAEVHNTYGGRHRYLLHPDVDDRATTAKEFYVSPFFPVDGAYRMYLPEPTDRLAVSITLHRPPRPGADGRPFVATVRGQRQPATTRTLLRSALRHPWVTAAVTTRIRRHGIHLYLRGLPVQPRPERAPVEGVR
jgi:DUF1365 family protein